MFGPSRCFQRPHRRQARGLSRTCVSVRPICGADIFVFAIALPVPTPASVGSIRASLARAMANATTWAHCESDGAVATRAELAIEWLRDIVRARPILSLALTGAMAGVLGGVVFPRLGRLIFIAATGYAANELWHREGEFAIDDLIKKHSR
jgi:hypothetical protein